MADGGRVTSLKPARQAKRKEADATGPQGGYGDSLSLSPYKSKRDAKRFFGILFFIYLSCHIFFFLEYHIITDS